MAVQGTTSRPLDARRGRFLGLSVAALAFLAYLPGSSRSFGYDASVTVGSFVATPSLLDPFREQVVYNNHVLFSFLEHVVYDVTGSRSEVTLRILPMLAGAAAVGLLAFEIGRRLGVLAGVAAAVTLGTNPMFVDAARDVRGYSLLVLFAIWSSALLARALTSHGRGRRRMATYAVTVACGLATHAFMAAVVLAHVAVAARRGRWKEWAPWWLAGAVGGGLAYVGVADVMLGAHRGRWFHASLATDTARELLGRHDAAVGAVAVLVVAALWTLRRDADLRVASAVVLWSFVTLWVVVQPLDLFPRFFVWLVPVVAALAAVTVARAPATLVLVLVAAGAAASTLVPSYTDEPGPYRSVAGVLDAAHAFGQRTCAIGLSGEPLVGYTRRYVTVVDADELARCDVAAWVTPSVDAALAARARSLLPFRRVVPPGGEVFCRVSAPCGATAP